MNDLRALDLAELAHAYRFADLSPVAVTRAYLDVLEEGNVYRVVMRKRALQQAQQAEDNFRKGIDLGSLQGIPIALKDLLDTEGEVTAACSAARLGYPAAAQDCPAVVSLEQAGAVFLGKTNMTELAFSGVGINPHFGTPGRARDETRIPGGSSSGSGVAVGKHLACAAIGSDTGGSVRIPSAFNGIVGLKTTDGTISNDGVVALSTTLDTLGPMARTVTDTWHLWRALAGHAPQGFMPRSAKGMRLLAPTNILQDGLDDEVAAGFAAGCAAFERLGAHVEHRHLPALAEVERLFTDYGGFASSEALVWHEDILQNQLARIDPRVSKRILNAKDSPASQYVKLMLERPRVQAAFWDACADVDAIIAPTVPILPPRIDSLDADEDYFRVNSLCLRNTRLFNMLGVPAASVPCADTAEGLSVGFMIAVRPHQEALALALAYALEQVS
jgi:aspartyl-tRNA(Asn)/glutamyl-tRNA(Gln) amidotransferase subunit A